MNWVFVLVIIALILGMIAYLVMKGRQRYQMQFIKNYHFHPAIRKKLLARYPHLTEDQSHTVFRGLRDYFVMSNMAGRRMVAMPSQVVDDAWHEFILFTRAYKRFCRKALGRFLHHTPTEAMKSRTIATDGIKRAWRLACAKEHIDPANPNRLPLIFAIDAMLNIPNGFTYAINCMNESQADKFCAGHIGCGGGCAGDSGSASDGNSAESFFDSLFDGDGCGGGCGGCGGD